MKRMWSRNEVKGQVQSALSSGDMKNVKVFEDIVDKDGHPRFIEGDVVLKNPITGVEMLYGKWSLSGTHLMIVACLSVADTTTITYGSIIELTLPEWVHNKIAPLYSQAVDTKNFNAFASNGTSQNVASYLLKVSNNKLEIETGFTATADRVIRYAYDLLIDTE